MGDQMETDTDTNDGVSGPPAQPSGSQASSTATTSRRPNLPPLKFNALSARKRAVALGVDIQSPSSSTAMNDDINQQTNDDFCPFPPAAAAHSTMTSPNANLEFIRSHSSGKLKFSPDHELKFTPEDLSDEGIIGQGQFGTVSQMRHKDTGRVMAVKGDCWICMELMDTSLEKFYKVIYDELQSTMPEEIIGKITVATLKALHYLKENLKIIHRDVKPSNILLDRKGRIKLCDFGIAGQLVDSIAKTQDVGCRPYMAVEIANGKFPYPAWNSLFHQLAEVVNGDPPQVAEPRRFNADFIMFLNTCLTKEAANRPKYAKLLEHRFVQRYENLDSEQVGVYVDEILSRASSNEKGGSLR